MLIDFEQAILKRVLSSDAKAGSTKVTWGSGQQLSVATDRVQQPADSVAPTASHAGQKGLANSCDQRS